MHEYSLKQFRIFKNEEDETYYIRNREKSFKDGHAHINNLDTAKYLIKLSLNKEFPHNLSIYLLECLIRINTDEDYINKIEELIIAKKARKNKRYINVNKGYNKRR